MVIGEMMYSDLDFSIHDSTTTSEADNNWKESSPVFDWDVFSVDEFNDLMDSMMDDEVCGAINPGCNSDSTAATTVEMDDETNSGDVKGLRLVHLLMAAAEALNGSNKNPELARVILVRLKELVSPTDGTNMERLAAYFTEALQGLMDGAVNGAVKHLANATHGQSNHHHHPTDVIAAFQLLQDMSPYVKFGHFTANQAILDSTVHDRRVHVIDYDIMEGIQWASLMQALVSRKDGPPAPHLRITALSRRGSSRRSIGTVHETGRRLIAFASSIGLSFSFHQCKLDSDHTFKPAALKLVKEEALVINCMLHLPHFNYRAPNSVTSFLSGAQSLNPRLVTLVEEEIGNMADAGGFLGRFMDILQHYSAVYDSLEAGFPMQARARVLVERIFLGPRIGRSLARIYRQSGDEAEGSWGEWLSSAGYRPLPVSFANHCQANLLIGLFNDGYRVEELASNRLVLGWKSRRLLSASIWTTSDSHNYTFSQ